jgi:hypothetical protein
MRVRLEQLGLLLSVRVAEVLVQVLQMAAPLLQVLVVKEVVLVAVLEVGVHILQTVANRVVQVLIMVVQVARVVQLVAVVQVEALVIPEVLEPLPKVLLAEQAQVA